MKIQFSFFCGLLLSLFVPFAANAKTFEGAWQGAIKANDRVTVLQETKKKTSKPSDIDGDWIGGSSRLRFVLHIITYDDGMTAKHDSPDQDAFGIPVTTITRDGAELKFEIRSIAGRYEGKINP